MRFWAHRRKPGIDEARSRATHVRRFLQALTRRLADEHTFLRRRWYRASPHSKCCDVHRTADTEQRLERSTARLVTDGIGLAIEMS
jgi:hypothetical protein